MRLAQLECKSAAMAEKEWVAGLLAYNLIRASMLCAALQAGGPPLTPLLLGGATALGNVLAGKFGKRRDCVPQGLGNPHGSDWRESRTPHRRRRRPPEPRFSAMCANPSRHSLAAAPKRAARSKNTRANPSGIGRVAPPSEGRAGAVDSLASIFTSRIPTPPRDAAPPRAAAPGRLRWACGCLAPNDAACGC